MAGKQRAGTVRAGWNVEADLVERVRAGSAARGIPANEYLERALRLVMVMQEMAIEEAAETDDESERWATNVLASVGLDPVTV